MGTSNRVWNALGFWDYTCGCIQFQDGWEKCPAHRDTRPEARARDLDAFIHQTALEVRSQRKYHWGCPGFLPGSRDTQNRCNFAHGFISTCHAVMAEALALCRTEVTTTDPPQRLIDLDD